MTPDKAGQEGKRARERSKTYPGIAQAMAEQWGLFIKSKMNPIELSNNNLLTVK